MEKVTNCKIALLLTSFVFIQCGTGTLCGDQIKQETRSPDGKHIATIFERDCGATTDFSTIVNIRPDGSGFVPDDGIVFLAAGQQDVTVRWTGGGLQVECGNCTPNKIFKKENQWNDIHITY